jgi:hypothetical protein
VRKRRLAVLRPSPVGSYGPSPPLREVGRRNDRRRRPWLAQGAAWARNMDCKDEELSIFHAYSAWHSPRPAVQHHLSPAHPKSRRTTSGVTMGRWRRGPSYPRVLIGDAAGYTDHHGPGARLVRLGLGRASLSPYSVKILNLFGESSPACDHPDSRRVHFRDDMSSRQGMRMMLCHPCIHASCHISSSGVFASSSFFMPGACF